MSQAQTPSGLVKKTKYWMVQTSTVVEQKRELGTNFWHLRAVLLCRAKLSETGNLDGVDYSQFLP